MTTASRYDDYRIEGGKLEFADWLAEVNSLTLAGRAKVDGLSMDDQQAFEEQHCPEPIAVVQMTYSEAKLVQEALAGLGHRYRVITSRCEEGGHHKDAAVWRRKATELSTMFDRIEDRLRA